LFDPLVSFHPHRHDRRHYNADTFKECNLKQNRKATLELFVEKADELRKEDFTQFIEEFGHQLSYQYTADPQQLTMTTVAPSQTMHKSFLLTYRMFVQGSEHMRLLDPTKKISPELLDSSFPRDAQRDRLLGKEKRVSKAFLHGTKTVRKVYTPV